MTTPIVCRRTFVEGIAASAALSLVPGCKRQADGEGSEVPPQAPQSVGAAMRAHYTWYCRNFFDFNEALEPNEREYLFACYGLLKARGHPISGAFSYSLATFSHRVKGTEVNSSRIYAASIDQRHVIRARLFEILRRRGVDPSTMLHMQEAVALGWDIERGHVKVYFLIPNIERIADPDIAALRQVLRDLPLYSQGFGSYTVRDGKVSEKKIYVGVKERLPKPVKGYPFAKSIIHTTYMVTNKRGIVPQVDLEPLRDVSFLNDTGRNIFKKYVDWNDATLDTIAYIDRDRFALYFP